MTYCIKEESLGFWDDPKVCEAWEVVSETAFGTEITTFPTLDEAVQFMKSHSDEVHFVQGLHEEECVITDIYGLDDLEQA